MILCFTLYLNLKLNIGHIDIDSIYNPLFRTSPLMSYIFS